MAQEEPKPVPARERLDVCELDRARMSLMNPALIEQKKQERTIDENAKPLLEMAMKEGLETVWDRHEMQQPPCKYCEAGTSCMRCTMGPSGSSRPTASAASAELDVDLIVARNLLDTIATGSAAHSDHGRDIVETLYLVGMGKAKDYGIADPDKLRVLAKEYGIELESKSNEKLAAELGRAMLEEYGMVKNTLQLLNRAPKATREIWEQTRDLPEGDRPRGGGLYAPDPDGSRCGLCQHPAAGPALQPLGRLGRVDAWHRCLGCPLRDADH